MKIQKILFYIIITAILLLIITEILTEWKEKNAADFPQKSPTDIPEMTLPLEEDDYALLSSETGLMPKTVDAVIAHEQNPLAVFQKYQKIFYQTPDFVCNGIAEISSAERLTNKENYYPFYELLPGDVLLTKSTHTLFYRHGHSGLIINPDTLMEASEIGKPTSCCKASDWGGYPAVMQIRIKDEIAVACNMTSAELGKAVAEYAAAELLGDDYSLLCGIGEIGIDTDQTQCAYLIWEAFQHFGIEVSAHKFPITPKSLLESGAFEVISYRGFTAQDIP